MSWPAPWSILHAVKELITPSNTNNTHSFFIPASRLFVTSYVNTLSHKLAFSIGCQLLLLCPRGVHDDHHVLGYRVDLFEIVKQGCIGMGSSNGLETPLPAEKKGAGRSYKLSPDFFKWFLPPAASTVRRASNA